MNQNLPSEAHLAWQKCLDIIQTVVPEQSFQTWFVPIVPFRLNEKILTIQVPSQFFYEWLEENYVHVLRRALDHAIGRDGMLEYSIVVDPGDDKQRAIKVQIPTSKTPSAYSTTNFHAPNTPRPSVKKEPDNLAFESNLNNNYTFESYIEGDCNRLARSAGMAVAARPGTTSFNPLMVYGGVGLGKTHLAQAIGNHIKQHSPSRLVLYASSEKFTNQFINAIKNNTLQDFTDSYMKVDTLILDDVQFLSGKEKTQDTFFHIFNHLHQSSKQIIMTSDRRPSELQGLQDRLLSRFKWGLTTDLQQPDFETRIAIIQHKLQADGIMIDDGVIEYVAHSVDSNVRELEGVVVSLMAQASLVRKDIDLELAKQVLKDIVRNEKREVTIDVIQEIVADYFDVSVNELVGKSRTKELVYPRQMAMYLSKEMTDLSLKSIGYHFGGRDHSTVIHSVQIISDMAERDDAVRETIQKIRSHFG